MGEIVPPKDSTAIRTSLSDIAGSSSISPSRSARLWLKMGTSVLAGSSSTVFCS